MIVTVTLNPAVDVSYQAARFQIDHGHRVEAGRKTAGGKGLNVSRVLSQLGEQPLCTGFIGGKNGEWLENKLNEEGLQHAFVSVNGETRTCIAILDEENNTQTELMEKGPVITAEEQEEFEEVFENLLGETSLVIASGSLPAGLPLSFYKELCQWAKSANIPVILDTSGGALVSGIEGKPFLIKPNKEELCQYKNQSDLTLDEMIGAAREICSKGVEYVLISMGAEGALLVGKETLLKADIPTIKVVNAVGSGDSTVAGMAYALKEGLEISECLKWACACGMSNAMEIETGTVQKQIVEELIEQITIRNL